MTKFYMIFDAINKSDFEEVKKKNLSDTVRTHLNSFVEYFNSVISIEIFAQSHLSWSSTSEYLYKKMDEDRRDCHNRCVYACKELNEICDYLNLEKICDFDIENRHEVAKFCGYIISGLYAKGIQEEKSFDKLIEEFTKKDEKVKCLEEKDEEDLTI